MDISSLGITGVAVITVICFLVGQVVKATGLDNKWIPIICGVFGAALGIALDLTTLKEKPSKRWETVVAAIITGVVGYLLARIVG